MNINTYSYRELQLNKIGKVYEYCIYSEMMIGTHIFDNDTFRQLYSLNQRRFILSRSNLKIEEVENFELFKGIFRKITPIQFKKQLLNNYDNLEWYLKQLYGVLNLNDFFHYGNILDYIDITEKNGKITTYFTIKYEGNIYQIIKQAGHFLNIEKLTNK